MITVPTPLFQVGHSLRALLHAIARLCAFICSERFTRAQLQLVDLLGTLYPLGVGLAAQLSVAA